MQRALALALALAGCGNDVSPAPQVHDAGPPDQAVVLDMATPPDLVPEDLVPPPPDLTKLMSTIGGPCNFSSDCVEGTTPTCFQQTLFNKPSDPTPGGYCSSPCATDGDCGKNGVCTDFLLNGKWCLARCAMPGDCRDPGYACFLFATPSCFPNDALNCDPSAGNGTCVTANQAGACLRSAIGPGNTGACRAQCDIGTGTCSGQRHCVFVDATVDAQSGMPTGDKFKGGICSGSQTNFMVGASCVVANQYFPYNCSDGAECYYTVPNVAPNGDYVCHQLCYLPGGGPVPDGGVAIPMNGMVAGPCPKGKTCTDVYKEGMEADPSRRVGFCLP